MFGGRSGVPGNSDGKREREMGRKVLVMFLPVLNLSWSDGLRMCLNYSSGDG